MDGAFLLMIFIDGHWCLLLLDYLPVAPPDPSAQRIDLRPFKH
jgi:hypothetical protein